MTRLGVRDNVQNSQDEIYRSTYSGRADEIILASLLINLKIVTYIYFWTLNTSIFLESQDEIYLSTYSGRADEIISAFLDVFVYILTRLQDFLRIFFRI